MPTTCPSPEKCLRYAETVQRFGINFLRVAVFIVFAWIGGLKAFQYEADGIVPFVANSPMMSFFYDKKAPEYKQHMNKEGAVVPANIAWHKENNTYGFAYGLGILIVSIGTLVLLGLFFPKVGLIGDCLLIIMTAGTLSFLITHPGNVGARPGRTQPRLPLSVRGGTPRHQGYRHDGRRLHPAGHGFQAHPEGAPRLPKERGILLQELILSVTASAERQRLFYALMFHMQPSGAA